MKLSDWHLGWILLGLGVSYIQQDVQQHPWHPLRRGQQQPPPPSYNNQNCLQTNIPGGQNHPRWRTTGLNLPNHHEKDISVETSISLSRDSNGGAGRKLGGKREACRQGEETIEGLEPGRGSKRWNRRDQRSAERMSMQNEPCEGGGKQKSRSAGQGWLTAGNTGPRQHGHYAFQ